MISYYLPEYNWSISLYKGEWVLLYRDSKDKIATDKKIINRINEMANDLKDKFLRLNRA